MDEELKRLVLSFDDEMGLPEGTYWATVGLINLRYGKTSVDMFCKYVDACEGRHFLKHDTGEKCWDEIWSQSKQEQTRKFGKKQRKKKS